MKTNRWLMAVGAALICLGAGSLKAQNFGGGNGGGFGFNFGGMGGALMDPGARLQRRLDSMKDRLDIADDAEWAALQPLVKKVLEAQQVVQTEQMRDQLRGALGINTGTNSVADRISQAIQRFQDSQGLDSAQATSLGNRLRQIVQSNQVAIASYTMASPEAEAIRKAVQNNAPILEMQAALAKFQEVRKAHRDALEKAQADLRKVLTLKQEAAATTAGLL